MAQTVKLRVKHLPAEKQTVGSRLKLCFASRRLRKTHANVQQQIEPIGLGVVGEIELAGNRMLG